MAEDEGADEERGLHFSEGVPVIDLGDGVRCQFTTRSGQGDKPCGLIEEHPRPDGRGYCVGAISFEPYGTPNRSWHVIALDPLTLEPSLLCNACGHHGWIRNGKWVGA